MRYRMCGCEGCRGCYVLEDFCRSAGIVWNADIVKIFNHTKMTHNAGDWVLAFFIGIGVLVMGFPSLIRLTWIRRKKAKYIILKGEGFSGKATVSNKRIQDGSKKQFLCDLTWIAKTENGHENNMTRLNYPCDPATWDSLEDNVTIVYAARDSSIFLLESELRQGYQGSELLVFIHCILSPVFTLLAFFIPFALTGSFVSFIVIGLFVQLPLLVAVYRRRVMIMNRRLGDPLFDWFAVTGSKAVHEIPIQTNEDQDALKSPLI